MDPLRSPAAVPGHTRNKSATKSTRPRSSTKGPLDADDALPPATLSPPPPMASIHGLTPSRYSSAQRPGSRPASSAGASSAGQRSPALQQTLPTRAKDFSFLLRPKIYHPLPTANVPPPFRAAEQQQQPAADVPIAELVATGRFRAAAVAAAEQLTGAPGTGAPPLDPSDHARIFDLIYTRLACLLLIDATALAAQEAKALEDLSSAFYASGSSGAQASAAAAHLAPWALRVLHVRLQALGFGDPRRAVMSYYELTREARRRIADATARHDNSARELWKDRLAELGIRVAGALIEMDDMAGAAAHLASLGSSSSSGSRDAQPSRPTPASRRIDMAKALLWLQLGDADAARRCMGVGGDGRGGESLAQRCIAALCDMADGEYETALAAWRELRADAPEDEMIGVNLAVCLLYVGQMDEGRTILEGMVGDGYASHTLLFNLATMYELCTDRSKTLKQRLAQRVADLEPSAQGWEKTNADFKL